MSTLSASSTAIVAVIVAVILQLPLEVYPSRGNGFAGAILGAVVALGLLIAVMVFISSKPKNRRRREP